VCERRLKARGREADGLDVVQAGRAVPVKFSLGGDRGLSIFASGHPTSQPIACAAGAAQGTVDETLSTGGGVSAPLCAESGVASPPALGEGSILAPPCSGPGTTGTRGAGTRLPSGCAEHGEAVQRVLRSPGAIHQRCAEPNAPNCGRLSTSCSRVRMAVIARG
jgi:hypothetical protein